jgi:hypothetical protein
MFRLSPLFQFRHGDHLCVFYRSEDALLEVLTPYVAEGIGASGYLVGEGSRSNPPQWK